MPYFNYGESDTVDKLNQLYTFFAAGPFNSVPLAGNVTMTGPLTIPTLTLTNALGLASGGTGATTAAAARANFGLTPSTGAGLIGATGGGTVQSNLDDFGTTITYFTANYATKAALAAAGGASLIGNAPAGSVAATTVQGAINEIATEYAAADAALVAASNAKAVGMKNRIINGACLIAQRPPANFPPQSSGYAGPDRYQAINNNATGCSFNQVAGTMTFNGLARPSIRQNVYVAATSLTGANILGGISQIIEGINCYDLKLTPSVASFWFNASVVGTYTFAIRDATGTYSYVTTFSITQSNVPTKIIIPIPIPPAGMSIALGNSAGLVINIGAQNTGSYSTAALNSWQAANVLVASTSTPWSMTNNSFIEMTELQLEPGTEATEYERRPYVLDLLLCQRYFWPCRKFSGICGGATALWRASAKHPVLMRAAPTLALSGAMQLQAGNSTIANLNSIGITYSNNETVEFDGTIDSQSSPGGSVITSVATNSNYIGVSAEL